MTSFLFWNLGSRRLESVLHRLTARHAIDVLVLAECEIPESSMLAALSSAKQGEFRRIPALASRGLDVYSRFDRGCFGSVLREADHYLIRTLTPPVGIQINIALAHLASPLHKKPKDQHSRCIGFAQAIREAETISGNDRTLVLGDLNLNPFDDSVLDVRGLNAVADSRTVLRKDPRRFGKVNPEQFRMFYNPMWSHFGDAVEPAGTYYYDRSNLEVDPLWNMFDQVLLRRKLLVRFKSEHLQILTTDGAVSFVMRDGRPNGRVFSDHLPIWIRLDLQRRVSDANP